MRIPFVDIDTSDPGGAVTRFANRTKNWGGYFILFCNGGILPAICDLPGQMVEGPIMEMPPLRQ
jgi:hypothetical protein